MSDFKPSSGSKANKNSTPSCPNHGEPLSIDQNPIPKKGNAPCPISGVLFAYEIDTDEKAPTTTYVKDAKGELKPVHGYKVIGDDK